MIPYRLLILGYCPPFPEWVPVYGVYEMLTFGITEGFRAVPHAEIQTVDVRLYPPISVPSSAILPPATFVLVVAFSGNSPDMAAIKRETGARKVVLLRENPGVYDHSFIFTPSTNERMTTFRLPCCKRLMANVPKVPGSLLVDHTAVFRDHTAEIESWLEGYNKGPVYRLSRPQTDNHPVPDWMQTVPYGGYLDYLAQTATFERHIITHLDSYAFGVVDFAARGTQVLTPPNLLTPSLVEELGIPVFSSRTELFALLDKPPGPEWDHKIDLCTDYTDIARQIDIRFQGWLQ